MLTYQKPTTYPIAYNPQGNLPSSLYSYYPQYQQQALAPQYQQQALAPQYQQQFPQIAYSKSGYVYTPQLGSSHNWAPSKTFFLRYFLPTYWENPRWYLPRYGNYFYWPNIW